MSSWAASYLGFWLQFNVGLSNDSEGMQLCYGYSNHPLLLEFLNLTSKQSYLDDLFWWQGGITMAGPKIQQFLEVWARLIWCKWDARSILQIRIAVCRLSLSFHDIYNCSHELWRSSQITGLIVGDYVCWFWLNCAFIIIPSKFALCTMREEQQNFIETVVSNIFVPNCSS